MSYYTLRPGISCCLAGGRLIFLDCHSDRYFGLPHVAETTILALIEGAALTASQQQMASRLADQSVLAVSDRACAPGLCRQIAPADRSLLDDALPHVPLLRIARTATAVCWARWSLTAFGLKRALQALEHQKSAALHRDDASAARSCAAAFASAALLVSSYDRCLAQSLAVARALASQRVAHAFVIGVHVAPFHAHCWVQQGSVLINDRIDVVREFTPILVL